MFKMIRTFTGWPQPPRDWTATISDADEDGIVQVVIIDPDGNEDSGIALRYDMARQWVEQELAILNNPARYEVCEHGLSAGLCFGPGHYGRDA